MQNLSRALRLRQLAAIAPRGYQTHQIRRISRQIFRDGQPLRTQAVRLRSTNPLLRGSTWFRAFISAMAFLWMLGKTGEVLGITDMDEEEIREAMEISEEEMQEQLDRARFFPLTLATKLPRTYYSGSDPEWQEFIRIAKDRETREKIKADAVKLVSEGAMRHPIISKWLGSDTRTGRSWFEFHFPDGPPEEYARGGIFWADSFIGTGTQEMTNEEYQQWLRSVWPVATGRSAWAAIKVLVGMQIRRIGQATGYSHVNPSSPEEKYKMWRTLVQHQEAMRAAKGQSGKSQTPSTAGDGSANTNTSIVTNNSSSNSSQISEFPLTNRYVPSWLFSDHSKSPDSSSKNASDSVSSMDLSSPSANSFTNLDLPVAYMVFSQTYRKITAPQLRDYRDIPRGNFMVQGLVEMMGSNGRVQFDMISAYDPEEKKFVNAVVKVRGHYPRLQAPKGGSGIAS